MANSNYSLAHTKWMCKYHIVFTPKYRRKIIYNQLKGDIREILRSLCKYKGVEILEGKLMPDHIHMLVTIPPKYAVADFMRYLKGKSALMIFDRHANLKYKFGNRHFCTECGNFVTYSVDKKKTQKNIRDKEYNFEVTIAVCDGCGAEVNVPGIMDLRVQEVDRQYREIEQIVSIENIENLMEVYNIGKAPLSLALGFGEITVTRYLQGQVPSKEYSDVMRSALESPEYMIGLLDENSEKIGDTAYRKALKAANALKELLGSSEKMLSVISYIFEKSVEITPLALQKILYYIQGFFMALFGRPIFEEDCVAWIHGPVYTGVYDMFKTFKYNPIDDVRFAALKNRFKELSEEEKEVIDLVIESFGLFSGKALERVTHNEEPWKNAREGYSPLQSSNVVIEKDDIKSYFEKLSKEYDLRNTNEIKEYIFKQLQ